jgi:hypothetical protein
VEQQPSLLPSSVGQQSPTRSAHCRCAEQEAESPSAFLMGSGDGLLVGFGVGFLVGGVDFSVWSYLSGAVSV